MKIIVDAFGGDNAPQEILKGTADAIKEYGITALVAGDETKIRACAQKNGIPLDGMEFLQADGVMGMEDDPVGILKEKANTSMAVGLKALADGKGDAFVSAGSTAALVVGATFLVKRLKGIKRAAIASVMPSDKAPFLLLDAGANVECTPKQLCQFAVMGDIYMRTVMGVKDPTVGLANIGVEETKGTPVLQEAYSLMKQGSYHFIGNVEVRDIPAGAADVVVSDGFTGNVILKMYEGVAGALMKNIKAIFKKSKFTMLGALFVKKGLTEFKAKMDYTEFGGAPLLGITKPVIKAHGSSNAKAIKNALRQAKAFAEGDVAGQIAANLPHMDETESPEKGVLS